MGLFKKNKKVGLIADVIRCDEPSYLIWKWRPDGYTLGEHKREYAIRRGSHLRVKDGEVAVFVYKQKNGLPQDYMIGPWDEKLQTANLPVLTGILGSFLGGDTPFQAEVYFINLAHVIQVKFSIPCFDVSDWRFKQYSVPTAVHGSITFKISDYKQFIKLHRLEHFDLDAFKEQIIDAVSRYVKREVTNAPDTYKIPIEKLETKLEEINEVAEKKIKERFLRDFGVEVSGVDVSSIMIDKTSNEYKELCALSKGVFEEEVQQDLEHREKVYRIQEEESQYAMHKQTQTANLGAFQIEKQVEVGIAGAEALGKMGENGAGSVTLGEGNFGFNPASMMASIAVGGVVGQSIAKTMSGAMQGINNGPQTPPAIPVTKYFVAVNGQSTGPYEINTLRELVISGNFNKDSLVWKEGMANWTRADDVKEVKEILPPDIPKND